MVYENPNMDIAYVIDQQNRPLNERSEFLKASFAQTSEKLDFIRKADGYNYVLGKLNIPEDLEFRIWKTTDTPNRSMNPEYIFKGTNEDEARDKFNEITKG